jgi:hypothetical protein
MLCSPRGPFPQGGICAINSDGTDLRQLTEDGGLAPSRMATSSADEFVVPLSVSWNLVALGEPAATNSMVTVTHPEWMHHIIYGIGLLAPHLQHGSACLWQGLMEPVAV